MQAETYNDDKDVLSGGPGDDTIWADDGDTYDEIHGGTGHDTCYVDFKEKHLEGCEVTHEAPRIRDLRYYDFIQCQDDPCYGSDGYDYIIEQRGQGVNDYITTYSGTDVVLANWWGDDKDIVRFEDGSSPFPGFVDVQDGDDEDRINGDMGWGGRGATCYGDALVEVQSCGNKFVYNGNDCWADEHGERPTYLRPTMCTNVHTLDKLMALLRARGYWYQYPPER